MNLSLAELRAQLTKTEQQAFEPVFGIDPDRLDRRSEMRLTPGFLNASFVPTDERFCPFEIGVGRGSHIGRVNVFVGLGAEFYNYEEIRAEEDAVCCAADISRFLRSTIECEQFVVRGEVRKAVYRMSLIEIGGRPIEMYYRAGSLVFARPRVRTITYLPWLR